MALRRRSRYRALSAMSKVRGHHPESYGDDLPSEAVYRCFQSLKKRSNFRSSNVLLRAANCRHAKSSAAASLASLLLL